MTNPSPQPDKYKIWANEELSQTYLDSFRGAIPLAAEQLEITIRVIQQIQPQVNSFLDLGCGNGILGLSIYQCYPEAKGCFCDISPTMIEAAKKSLADRKNSQFILQDYTQPQWMDAIAPHSPFDVIVSGFSIHHQPDWRKKEIYQSLYDLLNPGGLFLNLEHVASRSQWGEEAFHNLFVDALCAFHHSRGSQKTREEIDRDYYNRDDKNANILATVEDQCHWLREIGFIDVDCFMKVFEIALFGGLKSRVGAGFPTPSNSSDPPIP